MNYELCYGTGAVSRTQIQYDDVATETGCGEKPVDRVKYPCRDTFLRIVGSMMWAATLSSGSLSVKPKLSGLTSASHLRLVKDMACAQATVSTECRKLCRRFASVAGRCSTEMICFSMCFHNIHISFYKQSSYDDIVLFNEFTTFRYILTKKHNILISVEYPLPCDIAFCLCDRVKYYDCPVPEMSFWCTQNSLLHAVYPSNPLTRVSIRAIPGIESPSYKDRALPVWEGAQL